jgi:hypothetical protein
MKQIILEKRNLCVDLKSRLESVYCPNCGAPNSETQKFCRACGANISLVPQAMAGQLPEVRACKQRGGLDREPHIAGAVAALFTGIGFLSVAAAVYFFAPAGRIWWFWMLIPAFSMLGKGVAQIITLKKSLPAPPNLTPTELLIQDGKRTLSLKYASSNLTPKEQALSRITSPTPPPSVTESTTRIINATDKPAE